jgi:hypothetical protein
VHPCVGQSVTFSVYVWFRFVRYKSHAPHSKYIHWERFVQQIHFVGLNRIQLFHNIGTTYQNAENITDRHKISIPNCCTIHQMAINRPTSSTGRHSQIYPKWDFWLENIPSGGPVSSDLALISRLEVGRAWFFVAWVWASYFRFGFFGGLKNSLNK